MKLKGYVTNNTGRSRHIFKRTVYPGQRVPLDSVYELLGSKVPEGQSFVDWLESTLPRGWEISVSKATESNDFGGRQYKETLTAVPVVHETSNKTEGPSLEQSEEEVEDVVEDESPSRRYATPRAIDKMTAKDIYNIKLKDNPKRILKHINSIHKLRRALTMCKGDTRKNTLIRLIQGRIRELNVTL